MVTCFLRRSHTRTISALCYGAAFLFMPAQAAQAAMVSHGIAASVNDDIITNMDVIDRIGLVAVTTGLKPEDRNNPQLRQQVVQALIDETLQRQEASKNNISASEADINAAIGRIEEQRGKPAGSLLGYLVSNGASVISFTDQLQAQISWQKFLSRRISPTLNVSDEELKREIERLRHTDVDQHEVLLSGILLPIPTAEAAPSVEQLAFKLTKELRNGANFETVAANLSSQGAMTSQPEWVNLRKLEPAITSAITNLGESGISEPIRTMSGYQIINLQQKRTLKGAVNADLTFKQIILSLGKDAQMNEVDVLMNIARSVAKNPGTCSEKGVAGLEDFEGLKIDVDYINTSTKHLSGQVKPLVENLKLEEISEPFASPEGIHLMMLCEKTAKPATMLPSDEIRGRILAEKFELEALKKIRTLRREAFIDVRNSTLAGQ